MQSKSKALASLLGAGICAIFALGAVAVQAQDQKVDPNGTWKWTQPGRNGGPDREFSLTLKADGGKLTGSLTVPGRNGGDPVSTDISNGKIVGDQIAFEIVRDTQNGPSTNKYAGKIAGDTITGTQPGGRRRGGAGGGGGGTNAPGMGGGMAAGGTNAPDGATPPPPPAPTTRPWTATRSK